MDTQSRSSLSGAGSRRRFLQLGMLATASGLLAACSGGGGGSGSRSNHCATGADGRANHCSGRQADHRARANRGTSADGGAHGRRDDRPARQCAHGGLELLGPRTQKGDAGCVRCLHQANEYPRRGQYCRAQRLPGADQQLPPGQARRRLRLVRWQSHAVLRIPGPVHTDRRPLAEGRIKLLGRDEERVDRGRWSPVLHPDLQLPLGRFLPEELVLREELSTSQDARRPQDARDADAEGRPNAIRLCRQARVRLWAPSTS